MWSIHWLPVTGDVHVTTTVWGVVATTLRFDGAVGLSTQINYKVAAYFVVVSYLSS